MPIHQDYLQIGNAHLLATSANGMKSTATSCAAEPLFLLQQVSNLVHQAVAYAGSTQKRSQSVVPENQIRNSDTNARKATYELNLF